MSAVGIGCGKTVDNGGIGVIGNEGNMGIRLMG